ncbi:MAG: FGGY-family carbohydrate kinase [Candidatus Hodarchaeota archaeon]
MKKKYVLAHDVGTSSNKAVLVGLDTSIKGTETADYCVDYSEGGCAEQTPSDWWNSVTTTTKDLLRKTRIKSSDIIGLVFSTQMAGIIPVDGEGDPLMSCMTWLDTRASEQARKIWKGLIKISGYNIFTLYKFLRITGGAPGHTGKDPICKMLWLKDNEPDIYSKTFKFLDCRDYLLYKTTGKFVTSRDHANITWLMDTREDRLCWSDSILRKYGIEKEKLPEIKKATDIAGKITRSAATELGLDDGLPVIVGAGDMSSAAIGSGAALENQIHAYVGTSSWVACHVSERKKDIRHYIGSICSANPDMYLCVAEQETAGACLEWIKENIFRESMKDVYDMFSSMAVDVEPGSKGVIFTPWMFGERAPLDDATVRGGFHNLSLEHSRGHIVRSVFEGVAFNMKWALHYLEKLTKKAEAINMIGGGAISNTWCQIFADVLDRPIKQMQNPKEAGAKGAAIIAAVALGLRERLEDAANLIKPNKIFKPNPENVKIYERIFEEFKNIYRSNKQIYRRLNLSKGEEASS